MASADPASPHNLAAPPIPALPLELLDLIGAHADTSTLSALSRTCHALHALLARALHTRFAAEPARIALWAYTTHCPAILDRAFTLALAPTPATPATPATHATHATEVLRYDLRLALAARLARPAAPRSAQTIKVFIAHGISPTDMSCTPPPRRPGMRGSCMVGPRPPWVIEGAHGAAWMEYAVRCGDVALARWLLCVAGAGWQRCVEGGERTLVDIARERRGEMPSGENVEEMIQLLMDSGPRPIAPGMCMFG